MKSNLVAITVCVCAWTLVQPCSADPVVPAHERYQGDTTYDEDFAGRLLVEELSCATCHATQQTLRSKQAPILTSVMSHAKADKAIVDAGLKAQSVDSGLPVIFGRDDVEYVKCSDEHGVVADPDGVLKVNDKLKLVPGHCDPTCNVHDWYVGVRGGKVETLWPVSARGKAY